MEFKEINLSEWKRIGKGGNGAVYVNDAEPGKLLKLNNNALDNLAAVEKEFNTSKAIFDLGLSTPEMIEIVKVGNGFGFLCQQIKGKQSLSSLSAYNPQNIKKWAGILAEEGKKLHAIKATGSEYIPSMKEKLLVAARETRLLKGKKKEDLIAFAESLEDAPNLVHGDFQFGNLIIAAGVPYWIDLGEATHGNPMFDLGHFYLLANIFSAQKRVREISHMTPMEMKEYWNAFALAYNGKEGIDAFNAECKRYAGMDLIIFGHTRNLGFIERFFLSRLANKMIG